MFGWGTSQQLLSTRQVEDCLSAGIANLEAGDEAWIITPYATMSKLGPTKRGIVEAARRDAKITVVVRDEPEQVNPLVADMKEAVASGVKLGALYRLHAKVYWFENYGCILTSANLIDGSFESSHEIGLYVSGGSIYDQVRNWIGETIEPKMRDLESVAQSGSSRGKPRVAGTRAGGGLARPQVASNKSNGGYCIRCGGSIKYDPAKPFCLQHFKSWAQYSNMDYVEKHCHGCGAATQSSMAKPECYACFRRGKAS